MSASVRCAASVVKILVSVRGSGAGPDLLHLRCVAESWRPAICVVSSPHFMEASNRPMRPVGSPFLFVRTGRFQARIQFLVVSSMAFDCILEMTVIHHHVRAALPPQRKIPTHHGSAGAFLGARQPPAEVVSDANFTRTGLGMTRPHLEKSGCSKRSRSHPKHRSPSDASHRPPSFVFFGMNWARPCDISSLWCRSSGM